MKTKKYFLGIFLLLLVLMLFQGCTILERLFGSGSINDTSSYNISGTIYYSGSIEPGYSYPIYICIDPYNVNPSPDSNMRYKINYNRTLNFDFGFEDYEVDNLVLLVFIDTNNDNVLSAGDYYAYYDVSSGDVTNYAVDLDLRTRKKISVNITFDDTYSWSGQLWNSVDYSGTAFEYMIFNNPDISDMEGKITDVSTDGIYLYISGFYMVSTYQHRVFVYKISENGIIINKYESDVLQDDGINEPIAPVLVKYESNYVYLAFSNLYTDTSFLYRLDSNLTLKNDLSSKFPNGGSGIELRDMVIDPTGEPDIFLTGSYNNGVDKDVYLIRIPITAAESYRNLSNTGEDIGNSIILYNNNLYVAALYEPFNDGSPYAWVIEFDKYSLTDNKALSVSGQAEALGICYNSYNGNFYVTGYQKTTDFTGSNRYTLISKVYTDLSDYDNTHSFDESPGSDYDQVNDEIGASIFFDTETNKLVIPGYQRRNQFNLDEDNKASLTVFDSSWVRNTIIFDTTELSSYVASNLLKVTRLNNYFYSVGYVKDNNGSYRLLIVRLNAN